MAELDRYFQVIVDKKASDLHVSSGMPPRMHRSSGAWKLWD